MFIRALLFVLLLLVVLMLVRRFGPRAIKPREPQDSGRGAAGDPGRDPGGAPGRDSRGVAGAAGERMVACAVCGLHLPASDAVYGGGQAYCSAEHLEARRERQD